MFRLSGLLFLGVAVICGALLFQTSQAVQRAEQTLSEAKGGVGTEAESLRVLTTEWDYLNRPERLEKLTLQNTSMNEGHAEKVDFIKAGESVPEPEMRVLPQVKPKNILQYVSTQRKSKAIQKSSTIQNTENQNFNELVDGEGRTQ